MAKQESKSPALGRKTRAARGGWKARARRPWLVVCALAASVALSMLLTLDLLAPSRSGFGGHTPAAGEIADRPYKAPADVTLVDREATEQRRRELMEQAPVVYDFDERWGTALRERVAGAFSAARSASPGAGPDGAPERTPLAAFLEAFGEPVELPESVTAFLSERGFAGSDQADLIRLLRPALGRMIVADPAELERQVGQRRIVVRELGSGEERVLQENAAGAVLTPDAARERLSGEAEHALPDRSRGERRTLLALAQTLVRPNLSFNLRATDERRQKAAAGVKEVTISLRKGEIIVRDGVPITENHVRILELLHQQYRAANQLQTFVGVAGLIFVVLVVIWRFAATGIQRFPQAPKDAVFLLTTLFAAAVGTKLALFIADAVASNPDFARFLEGGPRPLYYLIPVAGATMLVRLVQSAETAGLFAMLSAPLAGLQIGGDVPYTLYALVGSLVAAVGAARVTQRGTLLRAGAWVGIANAGVICALALLEGALLSLATLMSAVAGFLGGCLAGGIVTGFAPLVETLFGYTTDVKLLEMANREQPVLRELEMRAPGTYHHSMMVGHLAEKAAEAIGANALLAKVAGYYHDIGKMRRPHFFVENVTIHHGENRHEKLSPSMSARIIQAHVKDGLELGRQSKLAPPIMRGIGEHHGTSIIRFFYEKAKELIDPEKGELVQEHEYRYPGPKPQTREAGILMLADSVEAASRTLVDTSAARIQQLVQRTINNYFRDGQLDECSLTLRDLHAIARSFIDTLSAIRHERIDYPDATDAEGRRLDEGADEGVVERLEPRKKDRSEGTPEKREDDLKRLGLS